MQVSAVRRPGRFPPSLEMADTHFMIEKGLEDGRTVTNIFSLDEEGSNKELARLLGGEEITETSLQNALEMRKMAKQHK